MMLQDLARLSKGIQVYADGVISTTYSEIK
jgi:hypothetical protein